MAVIIVSNAAAMIQTSGKLYAYIIPNADSETVAFNGTSIIYKNLTLNRMQSRRDSIRFRFRTSEADGILLYSHATQGDYIAMQVVRNKLILNMNLGL